VDSIDGFRNNVSIVAIGATYSGGEKETIEQVKYRAPYYYAAQNRAVTIGDYETLILKDYPNIDSVSAWGGEDNVPPVYGKVFLALKTKENFFLSNIEKESIKDSIIRNRSVLTVFPEIIDPEYKYILIRGKVYFNPNITSLTSGEIRTYVKSAIEDYSNQNLNKFSASFQKNKMQGYIEDSQNSITSSDVNVLVQKRFELTLEQTRDYTINFGMPIKKGDFKNSLSSYPSISVYDVNFAQRQVFFEEVPSIDSGIDSIEITNGGINYTSIPTVTITGDGTGATAIARIAGGKLYEIVMTNKGTNYSRAFVSISSDTGVGAVVKPLLQSRVSNLRTYYFKSNGEKVFVNNNAGRIDYDKGIVTLTSLRPLSVITNEFYDPNVLTISVPVDSEIINTVRNDIIVIDIDDPLAVQIEVVAE
jgi:hypothetical protein